jgi:hypothetical protein
MCENSNTDVLIVLHLWDPVLGERTGWRLRLSPPSTPTLHTHLPPSVSMNQAMHRCLNTRTAYVDAVIVPLSAFAAVCVGPHA